MEDKRLFTVAEVADQLGVTKGTVYQWTAKRRIECIKLSGRCVRYTQAQIDKFIKKAQHTNKALEN